MLTQPLSTTVFPMCVARNSPQVCVRCHSAIYLALCYHAARFFLRAEIARTPRIIEIEAFSVISPIRLRGGRFALISPEERRRRA